MLIHWESIHVTVASREAIQRAVLYVNRAHLTVLAVDLHYPFPCALMIRKPRTSTFRSSICHQLLLRLGFVTVQVVNQISFMFPLDHEDMPPVIELLLINYRIDTLYNLAGAVNSTE